MWDDTTNAWSDYNTENYVTSYTGSTGAWTLSVATADGPTYSPANALATEQTLRYKVEDENSWGEDSSFYDEFSITFNYECSDDSVSIGTGDDISTQTYINLASAHAISSSVTHLKTNCDMTAALW